MGLISRRGGKKLDKQHAEWQGLRDNAAELLDEAQHFRGSQPDGPMVASVTLHSGELVYAILEGAGYVEAKRQPGHWTGRSQGMSFHVAKGMSYRVGASRGTFVSGPEESAVLDHGTVLITNARVVFAGMKRTHEWPYGKLVACLHAPDSPWTALAVSNRQKTTGISYDNESAGIIRFRLELAVAAFNRTTGPLIARLQRELDELDSKEPQGSEIESPPVAQPTQQSTQALNAGTVTDAPATLALAPADWYADPTGAHRLRYWDGTAWTEHTA